MAWKEPDFDDRAWKSINVPTYWETQGYRGYDGFGWYRVRFRVPETITSERLILLTGKIDDYDEVYLNGERVGRTGDLSGLQGRNFSYSDTYQQLRAYTLAPNVLRTGQENVLAIRVYDGFLHGGLYDGPVGLIRRSRYLQWRNMEKDNRGFIERFLDFFQR